MLLLILLLILAIAVVGSWIVVDAVTAAAGTVNDPLVTWNLYVAPAISALSTALILLFINRRFSLSDKKDDEILRLKEEAAVKREEVIREWRLKYEATTCSIKNTVESIKEDMHKKVPYDFCNDREKEFRERFDKLDDRLRDVRG